MVIKVKMVPVIMVNQNVAKGVNIMIKLNFIVTIINNFMHMILI